MLLFSIADDASCCSELLISHCHVLSLRVVFGSSQSGLICLLVPFMVMLLFPLGMIMKIVLRSMVHVRCCLGSDRVWQFSPGWGFCFVYVSVLFFSCRVSHACIFRSLGKVFTMHLQATL